MGLKTWAALILGVPAVFIGVLFYLQNSLRTVDLSLDLYFAAWRLDSPAPVPAVVLVSFGLGLALGVAVMTLAWRRAASRVADLEIRLARSSGGSSGGGGAAGPMTSSGADL